MKNIKISFVLFSSICFCFMLAACFSPWKGDTATVTLNFSSSLNDTRAAADPPDADTLARLHHVVTLSSPPRETIVREVPAGKTSVQIELASGFWNIAVQAALDGTLYAYGALAEVEIKSGQDNPISVQMYRESENTPPDDDDDDANNNGDDEQPAEITLADRLARLNNSAQDGESYVLAVYADERIVPQTLFYEDKEVRVTIRGDDTTRIIELDGNGSIFTVQAGVTLILEGNITLQGHERNNAALVSVDEGGALVINEWVIITGNGNRSSELGGAVLVKGGVLTMNGGTIIANTAASGGGVHIGNGGVFTMVGGSVSGNTAQDTVRTPPSNHNSGGGVHVYEGTFWMEGGSISGNKAYSHSGGVYVGNGIFKKTGGIIYGNEAAVAASLRNTVESSGAGKGHAVYSSLGNSVRVRDTTCWNDELLLSFDGTGSQASWDGPWD